MTFDFRFSAVLELDWKLFSREFLKDHRGGVQAGRLEKGAASPSPQGGGGWQAGPRRHLKNWQKTPKSSQVGIEVETPPKELHKKAFLAIFQKKFGVLCQSVFGPARLHQGCRSPGQ